jgi:predicted hydrocarbon binding protein
MALSSLLQRLLFVNQFNIIDGKVEILGNRYIMLDASDLLVLQEIDKTKTYSAAKNSSKNNIKNLVEHAAVYKGIKDQSMKNIAELSKKIGKTDEGVIKTLQSLFDIYGLGKLEIVDLKNEEKKAFLKVKDSSIAKAQIKEGKSKTTVCTLTAGILAGIFSYIFKKDVDCSETKCLGKGDGVCEFSVS